MITYHGRIEYYGTIQERPTAPAYGVGSCMVVGTEYTSDGVEWSSPQQETPFTIVSGDWITHPTMFRLLLTGSGTITVDSKDSLGVVSTAVYTDSFTDATNRIGFPYAGDNSMYIRITTTGTVKAVLL
jgi:hypothetical protein